MLIARVASLKRRSRPATRSVASPPRLLWHLAMTASATTLLRTIRSLPLPNAGRPRVVGVDDWALRKGRAYATIIIALKRVVPLDLLLDRSEPTRAA